MTVGSILEGFRLGAPNLVGSIRNLVAIILALFSIFWCVFGHVATRVPSRASCVADL